MARGRVGVWGWNDAMVVIACREDRGGTVVGTPVVPG